MTEEKRGLVLCLCTLALLALVLLSVLVIPGLYQSAVPRRRPDLGVSAAERQIPSGGGLTELGGELPFPLSLNSASAEELALIPQLDRRTAESLVFLRQVLGGFDSLEQLGWLLDEETAWQVEAYLDLGSYLESGLPPGLDAEAEADRLIRLVAAKLERTDLDDAASLGELISLMEHCRERLVELMGEGELAQRTDYDELLRMLELRQTWLLGIAA